MDEEAKEYRQHLLLAEQDAQRSYDRTLITLASAGLGISFALVGNREGLVSGGLRCTLLLSWVAWGSSVIAGLLSHLVSQKALRKAVKQVDAGKVYEQTPGGSFAIATDVLNYAAGIFFVAGVVLFGVFLSQSLGGK